MGYCLPILKTEVDRDKLLQCAIDGGDKFFLGTDSAPHSRDRKENCCGCAGCFTSPLAVEMIAETFEDVGGLAALEDFVSKRGARFYGLPEATERRTVARETWTVPMEFDFGAGVVRPLRAGEDMRW